MFFDIEIRCETISFGYTIRCIDIIHIIILKLNSYTKINMK